MDAKRGYTPEDEKNFSPDAVERMRIASRHIQYLINEGVVLPDVGLCTRVKKARNYGLFWLFCYVEHIHIDRIFQRFFQKYSFAHKYSFEGDEPWGKSRMSLNLRAKASCIINHYKNIIKLSCFDKNQIYLVAG